MSLIIRVLVLIRKHVTVVAIMEMPLVAVQARDKLFVSSLSM